MTARERVRRVLNFEKPDRLPMLEWATWWDQTLRRWEGEGMPKGMSDTELFDYFGLDRHIQWWLPTKAAGCPAPKTHGGPILSTMEDYDRLRPLLLPEDAVAANREWLEKIAREQSDGTPFWISFDGFFWNPRTLLGIEDHLYSFYDEPELYHRICGDLVDWQLMCLDRLCEIVTPDFMTIAEDMSYNNGPMLSEACFDEFLLPYYKRLVPALKSRGIRVIIDTDGQVEPMIPWLMRAGIEGVLPMERQAGVDEARIRAMYPGFLMLGGYDKMTMFAEPGAMEAEFERLLPVMRSGGYIPSVDHQTPPQVSLAQYRHYLELFEQYCRLAAN